MACNSDEKIVKDANEIFESRKEKYISDKIAGCKRELMIQAEHLADSNLITLINSLKKDSIFIPTDTIKPVKPNVNFPDYKKPLKPDTTK